MAHLQHTKPATDLSNKALRLHFTVLLITVLISDIPDSNLVPEAKHHDSSQSFQ